MKDLNMNDIIEDAIQAGYSVLTGGETPNELDLIVRCMKLVAEKLKPLVDRQNETHEDAVKRYLNHPKDETMEERSNRINRFRSGY